MSMESSDVNNGFHFIWDIENIDVCFSEERITSPSFVANNLNHTEWCMSLHPLIEQNSITLVLSRTDSGHADEIITVDFLVSVSISDGTKDELPEKKRVDFRCGSSESVQWIYHADKKLFEEYITVYCQMQKSEKLTIPYICCSARTVIGKEKRYGVWKISNFKYLLPGERKKFALSSLMKNSPQIDILGNFSKRTGSLHIELQVTHNKPIFIFLKLALLPAKGSLKWSTLESYFFDGSMASQTYKFPLYLNYGYVSLHPGLLRKGTLTLLYELSVSTGLQYSEVSESNFLIQSYWKFMHREMSKNKSEFLPPETEPNDTLKTEDITENSNQKSITPQTLKDDLKKFYQQKKHCDVTLQAEKQSFPAHSTILCSRSPVFSAMFDSDMKEAVNKKVEIVDIDADTLDRFLIFMYSETLEDLQWNRATKLLYAANKYQVESLKKECYSYLLCHITASNVCEGLILADLYQNDQLKTLCQDFIFENASEIFSSKDWEVFTVENPLLSAKMLQGYFTLKK